MSNPIPKLQPQLPSNRKFGCFFGILSAAFAAYSFAKNWNGPASVAAFAAIFFIASTLLTPKILTPLNWFWYQLGIFLGKIVNPIILGIIFFGLITPISLFTRLIGRDELRLKKRTVKTYWIDRSPPGPTSDSFNDQY